MGEDRWLQVRKDLLNELKTNKNDYQFYFGRTKELAKILSYFQKGKFAHKAKWMTMPDMGHLIATRYNVVVIYLSQIQCLTFLPFRSQPELPPKFIVIGYIGDHFVEVN